MASQNNKSFVLYVSKRETSPFSNIRQMNMAFSLKMSSPSEVDNSPNSYNPEQSCERRLEVFICSQNKFKMFPQCNSLSLKYGIFKIRLRLIETSI